MIPTSNPCSTRWMRCWIPSRLPAGQSSRWIASWQSGSSRLSSRIRLLLRVLVRPSCRCRPSSLVIESMCWLDHTMCLCDMMKLHWCEYERGLEQAKQVVLTRLCAGFAAVVVLAVSASRRCSPAKQSTPSTPASHSVPLAPRPRCRIEQPEQIVQPTTRTRLSRGRTATRRRDHQIIQPAQTRPTPPRRCRS